MERDNVVREASTSQIKHYRDLQVWQLAIELCDHVYDITAAFPKDELYGLTTQMRRSAVSVASNIAEGSSRNGTKELIQFLYISRGSLAELETQLEIATRRKFCSVDSSQNLLQLSQRVGQMTARLIQSLQR